MAQAALCQGIAGGAPSLPQIHSGKGGNVLLKPAAAPLTSRTSTVLLLKSQNLRTPGYSSLHLA